MFKNSFVLPKTFSILGCLACSVGGTYEFSSWGNESEPQIGHRNYIKINESKTKILYPKNINLLAYIFNIFIKFDFIFE